MCAAFIVKPGTSGDAPGWGMGMKHVTDASHLGHPQLRRKLDAASAHLAACSQGIDEGISRPPATARRRADTTVDGESPAPADTLTKLSEMCKRAAARLSEAGAGPHGAKAGGKRSAGLVAIAKLVRDKLRPRRDQAMSVFSTGLRSGVHSTPASMPPTAEARRKT